MTLSRRTIEGEVRLEGVGLHLGRPARITFRPGRSGEGVVFVRTDLPGEPRTRAHVDVAVQADRQTQLGEGPTAIHTVEHVLAAVGGHDIDDLTILLDGPEPPIMDGSAGPYFRALADAKVVPSGGSASFLHVRDAFVIEEGESRYEVTPSRELVLDVLIDFPHPLIGRQEATYRFGDGVFARELADARTFGFVREVEALRKQGLIRGGSTENAVVLDESGVVEGALRWPDEFVRHKALDCVGDLTLAGRRVRAHIKAVRPSHRGTVALVRELARRALADSKRPMEIDYILDLLPHRYPMLLVDRILEHEQGRRVVGLKNVTYNEQFFQGHFPGDPVMPGVLIVEAMAQTGGILLFDGVPDRGDKVVYFTSVNNVKWRRPVRPGDQLIMEVTLVHRRGPYAQIRGEARVDGKLVCEADMAATVRER